MKKLVLVLSLVALVMTSAFAKKERKIYNDPKEATEAIMAQFDKNKDGVLTKNEMNPRYRVRRFGAVDTNNDRKISYEEMFKSQENYIEWRNSR